MNCVLSNLYSINVLNFFSSYRSVRLEELNVVRVLHALTFEEIEEKGYTPPMLCYAKSAKTIVLNENKDTEKEIDLYLNEAADWIHQSNGVVMVHAPEAGAFHKKAGNLKDSRRGEGLAAALCGAYFVKYQGMSTQKALESIK